MTDDIISALMRNGRLAWLASDANPDVAQRDAYRDLLRRRCGGPAPAYPPLATQAANLAGSLATWLRAGCPITPAAERARRRGICTGGGGRPACPDFDAARRRCRACGCFRGLKPWLGTATCPRGRWEAAPEPTGDAP